MLNSTIVNHVLNRAVVLVVDWFVRELDPITVCAAIQLESSFVSRFRPRQQAPHSLEILYWCVAAHSLEK